MKKIDWNRVVIAWAIGSLIALAGSHGANAVELGVVVTAKSDKPLVHTSVSSSKIDSVKPVTTIQGVTKTYRIPVEQKNQIRIRTPTADSTLWNHGCPNQTSFFTSMNNIQNRAPGIKHSSLPTL